MSEDAHSDGGAVLMDVTNTYEAQQGQLFLHLLENLRICQLAELWTVNLCTGLLVEILVATYNSVKHRHHY